jgi:hypothetical protein
MKLPLSIRAPGEARKELETTYAQTMERALLDDVKLMTSELVTNAVQHSGCPQGDPLSLRATVVDGVLRVALGDQGTTTDHIEPRSTTPPPVSEWCGSSVTAGQPTATATSPSGSKSTSHRARPSRAPTPSTSQPSPAPMPTAGRSGRSSARARSPRAAAPEGGVSPLRRPPGEGRSAPSAPGPASGAPDPWCRCRSPRCS